jgi:hypothetical protein
MILPIIALIAVVAIVVYFMSKIAKDPDKGQNGETMSEEK